MAGFLDTALSFPTVLFSFLLLVVADQVGGVAAAIGRAADRG